MTSPIAFELPPELAIDTDIARRVIGEFIRGQLRQAGFDDARIESDVLRQEGGQPVYGLVVTAGKASSKT